MNMTQIAKAASNGADQMAIVLAAIRKINGTLTGEVATLSSDREEEILPGVILASSAYVRIMTERQQSDYMHVASELEHLASFAGVEIVLETEDPNQPSVASAFPVAKREVGIETPQKAA